MKIRAIIFDLDDTLMNTSELLVEKAYEEAADAMIAAGLSATAEDCHNVRKEIFRQHPSENVFSAIAAHFGASEEVAKAGYRAFYARDIKENLETFAGVNAMLDRLCSSHDLFLVSAGIPNTQQQKVDALGIAPFFKEIVLVDRSREQEKRDAFLQLMQKYQLQASEVLCVGNRFDDEIMAGKSLGMPTCWVQHGEYEHVKPESPEDAPDYTVSRVVEIVEVCQL
tara:strand:+ start:883 stop:1557 length:675 start_codon:yes stop_codon:yes gene_type:complete